MGLVTQAIADDETEKGAIGTRRKERLPAGPHTSGTGI